MTTTGESLYALVTEYSALGEHRSGTPVDHATVEWFAEELRSRGADSVDVLPYTFPRYDVRWQVELDGEPVESIPLFYEAYGRVDTTKAFTSTAPVRRGTIVREMPELAASARANGNDAIVVATERDPEWGDAGGVAGLLYAPNRWPDREGHGVATVCVPGRLAGHLQSSETRVVLDAKLVEGTSANVVARFGDAPDEERVLLTTPLSGWFRAAGERGTGIAVLLAVAKALAAECPVLVLGTNGHELMGEGAKAYERTHEITARGIFHFGASVGSGHADGHTTPTERSRLAIAQGFAGFDRRDALSAALAPFGERTHLPETLTDDRGGGWLGEATLWCRHGVALVSIAGAFPLHHAPEDVPALATSPALLGQSFEVALAAARVLASV